MYQLLSGFQHWCWAYHDDNGDKTLTNPCIADQQRYQTRKLAGETTRLARMTSFSFPTFGARHFTPAMT
jgi:hypothetical protein